MVGKLRLRKIRFTFVFRYKWDDIDKMRYNSEFREYEIGFWFKKNRIVGNKDFKQPKEWANNLVNQYMFGINLLICKMWLTFDKGGM